MQEFDCNPNFKRLHNLQLYTKSPVFLFQNTTEFLEAKRVGFKEQIGCPLQKKNCMIYMVFYNKQRL